MSEATNYTQLIVPVAKLLWGEPTLVKAGEMRWGSRGSKRIDLSKGTFFDFEEEKGGGVLELVEHCTGRKGRAAADFLREQGILTVEEPAAPTPAAPVRSRLVASYDYTDEEGNTLFQVVRFEPKTFKQRRKIDGGWLWKLSACHAHKKDDGGWQPCSPQEDGAKHFPAARLVLYRLPEVLEAVALNRPVFLVEGEKDAETLVKLGMCATTAPMGAKKWNDSFTRALTDADVVIIPDADSAGEEHLALVAPTIQPLARRVRVLRLPIDVPDKEHKDVTDWVTKLGGTPEKLWELVDKANEILPPPFKSTFGAVFFRELDAPGPEHQWLMKGIWTTGERSMIVGPSQSGKSFLATDMALSVAQGLPYNGWRTRQGLVIYVAGEGGPGMKKRLRAYRQHHGIEPTADLPFVLLTLPVDLYASDEPVERLIAEIRQISMRFDQPLVLVVLDTLSASVPGADENASRDMGLVLSRVSLISRTFGTHVSIVHHVNAEGSRPRGWSGLFANLDSVIEVRRTESNDLDGRPIRVATVTKQKDGEDGLSLPFVLLQKGLGHDSDGDPITTCVVADNNGGEVETKSGKVAHRPKYAPRQRQAWDALQVAIDRHGQPPPPALQLPASVRAVVLKNDWVNELARVRMDRNDATSRSNARAQCGNLVQALQPKRGIGVDGDWVWPAWESLDREPPESTAASGSDDPEEQM